MEEKLISKLYELMQNDSDIEFEVDKIIDNIKQLDNVDYILTYKLTLLNYICILNKIFKEHGLEEVAFKINPDKIECNIQLYN